MAFEGFDSKTVEQIRHLLFPAIVNQLITGYNLYKEEQPRGSQYLVGYLHSDLKVNRQGKRSEHLEGLLAELGKLGQPRVEEKVVVSIIDRVAIYRQGSWRNNPPDIQAYTPRGERLSPEKLTRYSGPVILEGKQFELCIPLEDKRQVEEVLRMLSERVYAKQGEPIPGSWVVPVYTVRGEGLRGHDDMVRISEVSLQEGDIRASTFVKKKKVEFLKYVKNESRKAMVTRVTVNRKFAEEYLDL